MTKSLTLIVAAVLLGGCASTEQVEQPASLAMFFNGPYIPEASVAQEAEPAYYVIDKQDCADDEPSESGRSRCH